MLYPEGAERVDQISWFLQAAIDQGLQILNWYENLSKEDIPPEHLWEDAQGLEQWWDDVKARQEDGVSTKRGRSSSKDEDDSDEMVENDLARYLKQG